MSVQLTVGGVSLEFQPTPPHSLAPLVDVYRDFLGKDTQTTDIAVQVVTHPIPPLADLPKVFDTEDAWRMYQRDDEYIITLMPPGNEAEALWAAVCSDDFSSATVHCGQRLVDRETHCIRQLVQYPLDQLLVVHGLIKHQGLLVHAAGASLNGSGLVFPGRSGAGKSTLTRALIGDRDFTFLSDDRIVLRRSKDGHMMYGTPWPGDAGIARNNAVTLDALCFLQHSATTGLKPIEPRDALKRLLAVASVPWYNAEWTEACLSFTETLLNTHPCYELSFRPDGAELGRVLRDLVA